MEYGTPFIVNTDGKEFENNADSTPNEAHTFSWQKTNVWNNAFQSPDISCDFELLHNDMLEIKQLICDIKDILYDTFIK